jgi:RND superfamily putative drug exporter
MKRFSEFIVKNRWWVIGVWLIAAILIVSLSPSLSSVESNDQSSFLPKGYESVEAINIAKKLSKNSQDATDFIVFKNTTGQQLSRSDIQTINIVVATLSNKDMAHVLSVTTSPMELAPNRTVQLAQVTYSGNSQDTDTINTVGTVRDALHEQLAGTDLTAKVTGQEAISYDTSGQSQRALKIVSIGTLLLVLVLPALIFRSPFAGLLPILSVGLVSFIANALLADAAKLFKFHVSQQLSVIFTVVLFGIGTDYMLFLLFRYRERLRSGDHSREAVSFALSRAGLAILSAALVVLSSFSALFFAKFGIFSTMAPGLVICVGVMMLAALTLIPALVAIVQEKVFWPSKAWKSKSMKPTISKKIGGTIAKHPFRVATIVTISLVILGTFALGYKPDFSSFSQPPKGTESAAGYNELTSAFPPGVLEPTEVYVSSSQKLTHAELAPLADRLKQATGVSSVQPAIISANGNVAVISVILKNDPSSAIAINNVAGPIREAAHSVPIDHATVYVGGSTAVTADIKAVTNRDLKVIFPIAAVFIFVILALLLRSLVAPFFLLLCVGLGYIATLGATTLIFQKIGNAPGLIFFIPLFMYIFVVAIGTDYNILTITRLREEIGEGHSPRKSADLTVEHSSATVASAGLILAATFSSLLLAGISFLSQLGSAIAIGVALAAFVIAPFLIPSIAALLGYAIWWPGHRPNKQPPEATKPNEYITEFFNSETQVTQWLEKAKPLKWQIVKNDENNASHPLSSRMPAGSKGKFVVFAEVLRGAHARTWYKFAKEEIYLSDAVSNLAMIEKNKHFSEEQKARARREVGTMRAHLQKHEAELEKAGQLGPRE